MTKRIRNLFVAILSCLLVAVACVGMVSLVKADVTVITMTGTAEAIFALYCAVLCAFLPIFGAAHWTRIFMFI